MFQPDRYWYAYHNYDSSPVGELRQRQDAMAEMYLRYDERLSKWRGKALKMERLIRNFPMQRPWQELANYAAQGGKFPSALEGWTDHVIGSPRYNMLLAQGKAPTTNLIRFNDMKYVNRPEQFIVDYANRQQRLMDQIIHFETTLRFKKIDMLDVLDPDISRTVRLKGLNTNRRWWRVFLPGHFWLLKDRFMRYMSRSARFYRFGQIWNWRKTVDLKLKRWAFESQLGVRTVATPSFLNFEITECPIVLGLCWISTQDDDQP